MSDGRCMVNIYLKEDKYLGSIETVEEKFLFLPIVWLKIRGSRRNHYDYRQ